MSWASKSTTIIKLIIANHEATQYHWNRSLLPNLELSTFSKNRLLLISVFQLHLGEGKLTRLINKSECTHAHTHTFNVNTNKEASRVLIHPPPFAKLAKEQGKTVPALFIRKMLIQNNQRDSSDLTAHYVMALTPLMSTRLTPEMTYGKMTEIKACHGLWQRLEVKVNNENWRHETLKAYCVYFQIQRIREEMNWHGTPTRRNGDFIQVDNILRMKGCYEVN